MNAQNAMRTFDSAILVMAEHAALYARGDVLTRLYSAFRSFDDLLQCNRNYRPSINMADPEKREFADLYDAAQQARGDSRRAYRFGNVKRKGSLIDKANYIAEDNWYRLSGRIAWFDRYTRLWTCYNVTPEGYQDSPAEYYPRYDDLLQCEHAHA